MDKICTLIHAIISSNKTGMSFKEIKDQYYKTHSTRPTDATLSTHLKHLIINKIIYNQNRQYAILPETTITYIPTILVKKLEFHIDIKKEAKPPKTLFLAHLYHSRIIQNLSDTPLQKFRVEFHAREPTGGTNWKSAKLEVLNEHNRSIGGIANYPAPDLGPKDYIVYAEISPPLLKNETAQIILTTPFISVSRLHIQLLSLPYENISFKLTAPKISDYDLEVYLTRPLDYTWEFFHQENVKKSKNGIEWSYTFNTKNFNPNQQLQLKWYYRKEDAPRTPTINPPR